MTIIDNDLLSIQEARILAENAYEAQKQLATFSQENLDVIVESMANELEKHTQALAILSHEETDFGDWQHKLIKNEFVCGFARRNLRGLRCVGIIGEDREKQTKDVGVPVGVIAALCPATSPVSTTIYNALIAIKSGNAIVFSPHPRAQKTISKTLDIMIEVAHKHGLPEGALTYMKTVAAIGTIELMKHKLVSLVLNTGVPGMLEAASTSGKPFIYGGAGNGPAFVERTADIQQAAKDIIASKTFDHGVVSAAGQSVVVDGCVAAEVKSALQSNGAYFMSEQEAEKLGSLLFYSDGKPNHDLIGIPAVKIAQKVGFIVPDNTTVLIAERKYVSEFDPYSREKLCPVLGFYIEPDWMHACEKCIELLLSDRCGHTLVIHSKDENVINQFALKKPVGRVLVNTPAAFGSMGATTNLFPSMMLGSGSAGKGFTSDNVSPMNLIYIRKVGYGVRNMESIGAEIFPKRAQTAQVEQPAVSGNFSTSSLQAVHRILKEAIGEL
ncbi:aldehyde dehydrogenase family protein [Halodesulfovibrio sp.]|jgi:acyl-CoA reductase-like NAD-dependent aldehyde dehydrogenase|uniref:aldehyde dehydrogenase family protein n=1 Tax=Halodesulfovibrio sp. TaxID=1912772 RepID=UPI0025DE2E9F|nr:aldehyde dehydrogenase family protein [Halodesulfovibrio sp.]MCT4535124.1 aldehyde dehydrogenase family protein [Halodesulfovibrio sp.]